MNYIATMEFVGHHRIEFEAESDEEAKQMVEDYTIQHTVIFEDCRMLNVEECFPINLIQEGGKDFIWQISKADLEPY